MTSKEIRESFFKFFQNKEHQLVPSAPIVVKDDPTLMFTNAGMNQFKDVFLGNKTAKHSRLVDTQKCLRVSGKHNDLEEVGVDTYHHTMFEMLGNWSFGDFFKAEMIPWAWEFLTEELGLAKDRLYITIFEGDEEDGLSEDRDAYDAWAKILPSNRILKAGKKDNFWEMGEVGPCGPCSEIHMDIRDEADRQKVEGSTLVNQDHPQVVEIWNLVFMEFNRTKDKSLKPLPNKHVDTGMGFERLCMAIQGTKSNYDTDVFQPSIKSLEQIAQKTYGASQAKSDIAFRVIVDHIRA
ncbi:MAG: alanine--tRNA ligase-related protein, partial [Vicingaceae bacterium]